MRVFWLPLGIFLLGLFLRILLLHSAPSGFHRDEASVGYNAYSLLKIGRDEYGRPFPLIFEALRDNKLPTVIYTTVLNVAIFGLDDFAVRLPTAVFGALTPVAVYLLVRRLSRSDTFALYSAFFMAISPWNIIFSRTVNESTISILLATMTVYLVIRLLDQFRFKWFVVTLVIAALSMFTYRAQYVFMPLMLFGLGWLYRGNLRQINIKGKIALVLQGLIVVGVFSHLMLSPSGNSRFVDVGLHTGAEVRLVLEEQIREDASQTPIITRLFHNKLVNFAVTAGRNYTGHFNLVYLFFDGYRVPTDSSTPFMGYLYFLDLPFFILGLFALVCHRNQGKMSVVVILWLLAGPVPAAFTVDSPSSLRDQISTVGFAIAIAYGLFVIVKWARFHFVFRLGVAVLAVLGYMGMIAFFLHQFAVHKRVHQPWYWDVGINEAIKSVQKYEKNYEKVVWARYSKLYIFLLYYRKVDPKLVAVVQKEPFRIDRDEEIITRLYPSYQIMSGDCIDHGKPGVLYICTKEKIPYGTKVLDTIRYADDQPAFTLMEFLPPESIDASYKQDLPRRYSLMQKGE